MIGMSYASREQLRMRTAKQVLQIFSRSERIWHDMHLALNQWKIRNAWNEQQQSLVVRQWIKFELDMEFRCFIAGGRATAIFQYRHLCFFPRLVVNRDLVLAALTAFLQDSCLPALKGVFPMDDYVLDLGVELDPSNGFNILNADATLQI